MSPGSRRIEIIMQALRQKDHLVTNLHPYAFSCGEAIDSCIVDVG